jgi:hypothetical protein
MPVPQISSRLTELPARTLRAAFAGIGQLLLVADRLRSQAADPKQQPEGKSADDPRPARGSRPAGSSPSAGTSRTAGTGREAGSSLQAAGSPPAAASVPAPAPERPAETAASGEQRSDYAERWRSLDKTGNVRLLTAADLQDSDPGEAAQSASTGSSARPAVAGRSAAEPATADGTTAEPVPAETAAAETTNAPAESAAAGPTATSLPVPNYDDATIASLRARLRNLDVAQLRQLAGYERVHAARPDVLGMFERRIARLESES